MSLFKKNLIYFLIITLLGSVFPFQGFFYSPAHAQSADQVDPFMLDYIDFNNQLWPPEGEEIGAEPDNWQELAGQQKIEVEQSGDSDSPSQTAAKKFPSDKIILNPIDRRKLEQMKTLADALPDFNDSGNLNELAALSGVKYEDLVTMKTADPAKFNQIVTDANKKTHNDDYLIKKVSKDPVVLAQLFNSTANKMASEIQNDPTGVEKAVQHVIETQIDARVIKTLIYLITPKDQGGAGHWRIKVERITKNYDKEGSKWEKEDKATKQENSQSDNPEEANQTVEQVRADTKSNTSELEAELGDSSAAVADIVDQNGDQISTAYIGNKNDEDYNTISSHYSGQAVDISEVDDIRCTLISKAILKTTKKPQPPVPIKLKWQTKDGYGEDKGALDSSYNQMFLSQSQRAIVNMLSSLNVSLDNMPDISGANFSDILSFVGQAFMADTLSATPADIWKFSLSDTLSKLGGVILADNLEIERDPFVDTSITSIDQLSEAVGESLIESGLNLDYGAIRGSGRSEILTNIGKSRILSELKLPSDVLDGDIQNSNDLYQKIGSRLFESTYGLDKNSFYGKSNLNDIKTATGSAKIDALLVNSTQIDQKFGLPNGTTAQLSKSQISPADFCRKVAEAHMTSVVATYGVSKNSSTSNSRDEIFNLPKGTIDRFMQSGLAVSDYQSIAVNWLAKTLETNDTSRARLTEWLNNPNQTFQVSNGAGGTITLPKTQYGSQMGISEGDILNIFVNENQAVGTLKRIGSERLVQAFSRSDTTTKRKQHVLNNNPEFTQSFQSEDFYKERMNNITKRLATLQKYNQDLSGSLSLIDSNTINDSLKKDLTNSIDALILASGKANSSLDISAMLSVSGQIAKDGDKTGSVITDITNISGSSSNGKLKDLNKIINAIRYESEVISKNAYEVVTGNEQSDFRLGDMRIGDIRNDVLITGDVSFSSSDVALLFAGKIAIKEFLSSAGSAKISSELGLPRWALKYASSVLENTAKDNIDTRGAFLRAVGIAQLEEQAGLNSGTFAQSNTLGTPLTIQDLVTLVANKSQVTKAQAEAKIADSLNLNGFNLSSLERGDFAIWSLARVKAEDFDFASGLPTGATERFIKGESLGQYNPATLSNDSIRQIATKLNVSESSIKSLIAAENGQTTQTINKIYFVDRDIYFATKSANDQSKIIDNNSYVYYDKDGLHTFNSYSTADTYRKNNNSKEIGYSEEIANALAKVSTKSATDIKLGLENFVKDAGANSFDDVAVADISNTISANHNIAQSDILAILTRSGQANGKAVPMDYLKMLGYGLTQSTAGDYMNDYLGTNFGSAKITPFDIYQIFTGGGSEVFSRIGATMLNSELGVQSGIIESMAKTTNDAERTLLIEQASFQMIGQNFGADSVSLFGSSLVNFGASRIEQILGLPQGSFKGNNFDELLKNVPIEDLVRSLNIPYTADLSNLVNDALVKIGILTDNQNKNFFDKFEIVRAFVEGLGRDGSTSGNEVSDMFQNILNKYKDIAVSVFNGSDVLAGGDSLASAEALSKLPLFSGTVANQLLPMIESFNLALNLINGKIGFGVDIFKNILAPTIFKDGVNEFILTLMKGDSLLNVLGLVGTSLNADKVNQFIGAIKNVGNGNLLGSSHAGDRAVIYDFLQNTFSLTFDSQANFTEGTVLSIINQPGNAGSILLAQGARMLDAQLDLLDKNGLPKDASVSNIIGILTVDNPADNEACDNPDPGTYSSCINQRRVSRLTDMAKSYLTQEASEIISSYIGDISTVLSGDLSPFGTGQSKYNIEIPIIELQSIFSGDFRPLTLVGMAMTLPSIIGDKDGKLAVAQEFIVQYQDFYTAIFGNQALEDAYAERARQYQISVDNGTNTTLVGFESDSGINFSTSSDQSTSVAEDMLLNYPISDGAVTSLPAGSAVDSTNFIAQQKVASADAAEASARAKFKSRFMAELEYKTMDCMLYKLDQNIPLGFAKAMFGGNSYARTSMLTQYVANWILKDNPLKDILTPDKVQALFDYFAGASGIKGNLTLLTSQLLAVNVSIELINQKLDELMPSKIAGFDLKAGTAGGLIAFAATGSLTTSYSGLESLANVYGLSGTMSFANIINGWGDNIFGLPTGSLNDIFNTLKTINALLGGIKPLEQALTTAAGIKDFSITQADITALEMKLIDHFMGEEFAKVEASLGLPRGILSALTACLIGGFSPMAIGRLILTLLFSPYKIELICSADGYYPSIDPVSDPTKWDVSTVGEFNGMKEKVRQEKFIQAAQYKAGKLVLDTLTMSNNLNDIEQIPIQIMTGRVEDVGPNVALVKDTICDKVGSSSVQDNTGTCAGWRSRSGLWANPQTTAWTHIGF